MSDGTQLNPGANGDLISDEDLTGQSRGSPALPQVGTTQGSYKLERTKIVVGAYGYDLGDATQESPLAVESRAERQRLELAMLGKIDASNAALQARAMERRWSTFGARGLQQFGSR